VYHANLRTDLGWLRHLLVTPQSHRRHHSPRPEHRDRNFGGTFSFWDRLFGTAALDARVYPRPASTTRPSRASAPPAAPPWPGRWSTRSSTRSAVRRGRNDPTPAETPAPRPGSIRGMDAVLVIDSHTGGEPTRTVVAGGPDLGAGPLAERRERFSRDFDRFRSAVVCEPRGSDVVVGALLVPPTEAACAAAVIFFNNVGTLGMCGHGTIGVIETLRHQRRLGPGAHRIETPVGVVAAELHADGRVTVENVASRRHLHGIAVDVPGVGRVRGDVAWGGNWFFLVEWNRPIDLGQVDALTDAAWRIRGALAASGTTGAGGAEIDHIELFGPPRAPGAHSRSFVLCPGRAYDRSPCGTGTSAKIACLADDGKLAPGAVWIQESVVGSVFEASYRRAGDEIVPRITGRAHVTGEARLFFAADDPFRDGIRAPG
jgi:4-hydroxyproline epimerase